MKTVFSIVGSLVLLPVLLLVGCGGGGNGSSGSTTTAPAGSTLSGTASAGAPVIGTVTIKDSATPFNTKTVTIAADGKYSIDVTGLTAPFMLRADGTVGGRSYSLYSAAVSSDINGTINVTPLTDLIVANVAGQIASSYFASGNFRTLTAADLTAQETALQARLQPILTAAGVGASIDLLRSSFAANNTGLDAALDALRVTVDPNTARATILNIIDNQQIIDDLASRVDASVIVATSNVTAGLTELRQIVNGFEAFGTFFATALPASNNASLLGLFDSTFLFDGQNTNGFLSELTSDPKLIGVKFTSISLVPLSMSPADAPTTAKVSFQIRFADSTMSHEGPIEFTVKKVGSVWKLAGNQRIAQANAFSFARLQDVFVNNVHQPNYIDTGLSFEIQAPTTAGLAAISAVVPAGAGYYAIVTGAGLPGAGALYASDFSQTGGSFFAAAGTNYSGSTTPRLSSFGFNQYPLSDSAIAALGDNAVYTIKIFHDNATVNTMADDVLLATYTSSPGKRPYLKSELAVASFATFTAPSQAALTTFANTGGTIAAAWTLPTSTQGAKSRQLHYFRSGSAGSDSVSADLASSATSASLTRLSAAAAGIGTVQGNGINLFIEDQFNRELVTILNGN